MTRKKVVNDDLFKRKFVVVNFWCFLQSWCIRLRKKNSSSWREFLEMPVNLKNIVKKADMAIFCCVNIGKPKNTLCVYCCAFQQLIAKLANAFSLHWSSKLFVQYWNWYQCSRKCKKSFWYLKVEAGRKSSSSAVDCGKWASSSRFKIANS